jgi:hypothetical protein
MNVRAPRPSDGAAPGRPSPWAGLHEHVRALDARVRETEGLPPAPTGERWPPLRSAQRFARLWQAIRTEETVRAALSQAPRNAGPLNSHRLVLRALALMQQLSPAYLHHFVAWAETLMWLDEAQERLRRGGTAPAPTVATPCTGR